MSDVNLKRMEVSTHELAIAIQHMRESVTVVCRAFEELIVAVSKARRRR